MSENSTITFFRLIPCQHPIFLLLYCSISMFLPGQSLSEITDQIQILSPGIEADGNGDFGSCDPAEIYSEPCLGAVTDKITVFRWNSTLPLNTSYTLKISDSPTFQSELASIPINDIPSSNKLIGAVGHANNFNVIQSIGFGIKPVFWKIIAVVGNNTPLESTISLIYYTTSQYDSVTTILGQVVQSNVQNSSISGANITIQSANIDLTFGNEPDGIAVTSTDDNGNFLAVSVPDFGTIQLVFPFKVIVNKKGFREKIEVYTKEEFESLSSLIIKIFPNSPPPPQTENVSITPVYQLLLTPD